MRISSTGDTGFGTSNPQSRIDVGGGYMANEQGRTDHVANTMPSPYYRFDGGDDFVDVNTISGANYNTAFTIEVQFYPEETQQDYSNVFDLNFSNANHGPRMERSSGEAYRIIMGDSGNYWSSDTTVFSKNKWHHVVYVIETSATVQTLKTYLNGVLAATKTESTTSKFWAGSLNDVNIGRGFNTAREWRGSISKFYLYNTNLTATEVKELYSGASVPFKYKGASQTELVTNGDFAGVSNGTDPVGNIAGWGTYGTPPTREIQSETLKLTTTAANTGARLSLVGMATIGKQYRLRCTATGDLGANGIHINGVSDVPTNLGPVDFSFTSPSTDIHIYFRTGNNSAGTTYFDNISVTQIGAVAEYDGSSATTSTWYDKSGNGLDGTVTGATLQNKVQALEVAGNMFFNGSTNITSNTADGSDNAQIVISGGGSTVSADTRGASIHLAGNENGNGGLLQLRAGDGSVGGIRMYSGGTERVRIVDYGLTFNGDTAAANALDDYEEGTLNWKIQRTDQIAGTNEGTTRATYTKIGNKVFISGYIYTPATGNSSSGVYVRLLNTADNSAATLPFVPNHTGVLHVGHTRTMSPHEETSISFSKDSATVYVYQNDSTGDYIPNMNNLPITNTQTHLVMSFQGVYTTDS
jgi:hypothetical protein